jgi:hypothetical protein
MLDAAKGKERLLEEIRALRDRVAELDRARSVSLEIEENLRVDQEQAHAFGERLTSLVEIGAALARAETLEILCIRAVELAGRRLRFECVALRLRGPDSDELRGAYRMDFQGQLVDEHEAVSGIPPQGAESRILRGREPFVLETNVAVQGEGGRVTGHCSRATVAVLDGSTVIGLLQTDNRVTHRAIDASECELLRLFASLLGHLYSRRRTELRNERLIVELQDALAKIKTLRGLLPVCCVCRKIRNDDGYWGQLEEYVQEHSEAEFSHGICPDCAHRIYPDLYEKALRERDASDLQPPTAAAASAQSDHPQTVLPESVE